MERTRRSMKIPKGRRSFKYGDAESRGSTPERPAKRGAPILYETTINYNKPFDPKDYLVPECTERDIIVYKEIFDFIDIDSKGMLTPLDLRRAIIQYGGYQAKRNFVYQLIAIVDRDESGQINFREFVKMMTQKPCEQDTEDDIERVFNQIDIDQKGFIDSGDLLELARDLKEDITEEDAKRLIKILDPQNEGKISYQAFLKFNRQRTF